LPPPLHANHGNLGLFPRKQYVICFGLVKGKKGFGHSMVSHRSPDVTKLFSVIRDGSGNIKYKISKTKVFKTIGWGHVKRKPSPATLVMTLIFEMFL
jgi:hypothetical protein